MELQKILCNAAATFKEEDSAHVIDLSDESLRHLRRGAALPLMMTRVACRRRILMMKTGDHKRVSGLFF